MKKISIISLITILFSISALIGAESTRKIIKIDLTGQNQQTIKELFKLGLDITLINGTENYINALVNEPEFKQIKDFGFDTEILLPDADAFARYLRETGYLEHFHSYDQMLQEMQEIVANHSDIARLEDIGDSYEKTVGKGGYDIWALKISDDVNLQQDEPAVFFMANIHAREIITPEIIMHFMHYLVDNYGTDPYVTYLVNNRQIWVSPTINPDGHEYVFSGTDPNNYPNDPMWWRKNKRDNNDNGVFDPSIDGVDLNRNFGYMWGYDNIGSSPNPGSQVYRGTGPFSEPESQTIRDFIITHNFLITLSFHSYGQMWLYPWGYIAANTPDHLVFVSLADSSVAYNGYEAGNSASGTIYIVNGDTDDWFYGEQTEKNKIFGFTPEVGSEVESIGGWTGFFPDTMYIEKQIAENQSPMLYLAYAAGEEPIIEPQLYPDTEDPVGPYTISATIKPPIVLTQPVALVSSSFKLYYNTTGIAPFDSTTLIPTGIPDKYQGEIPGQGKGVIIYYYLTALDSIGRTGHAPRVAPAELYSFSVGSDTTAPVITHTPLSDQSVYAKSYTITALVTDNTGIARVMLFYRRNGAALDSLEMSSTESPDEYKGVIVPDSVEIGDVFEYRIVATDISQNANTTTEPTTGFYSFQILGGYIFDFESDNGGFTTNTPSDWQWGTPTSGPFSAHSGSKVWATKLAGDYSNSSDSWLDMPPIDLTAISSATLTFWHWYLNEYSSGGLWDGGNVKISVNGGPFEIIFPQDGYDGVIDDYNQIIGNEPAFGGPANNGNFWHKEYFDLSPYVNNTVVIRFHFGSDDNTTEPGWYIDDVQILMNPLYVPLITNTTILPNTSDNVGPYIIQSKITDDMSITSASLFYSTDSGSSYAEVAMTDLGQNIYQGEIPGQPYGTSVNYYVQAIDNEDNVSTDPENAPEATYNFYVTDRVPEISVFPTNFSITVKQGEYAVDSILVVNNGLLDLHFAVWDSLLSERTTSDKPNPRHQQNFSLPVEKIKKAMMGSKIKYHFPQQETTNIEDTNQLPLIIYDPQGDIEGINPGPRPDIIGVYAEKDGLNITFEIEFAEQIVKDSSFVLISVDIDQDMNTGGFPPRTIVHDIGVEFELFWDTGNMQNLPAASVLVLDYYFATFYGFVAINFNGNKMSATIPLYLLGYDDGNMNIGVIAIPQPSYAQWFDVAPNVGHGVVGYESGVPWLSEQPTEGTIGGEDSMYVYFTVNGATVTPGDYNVAIIFSSNDPITPDKVVPLDITVQPATKVDDHLTEQMIPQTFAISQNYPNPFNPETIIKYQIPQTSQVVLKVFNILGQEVQTLVNKQQQAGYYSIIWNGKDNNGRILPSGVYIFRMMAGDFIQTKKMILLQ